MAWLRQPDRPAANLKTGAALGVLDREGRELERFLYLGIDEETRRAIGRLPRAAACSAS